MLSFSKKILKDDINRFKLSAQTIAADPKTMQQINFNENLNELENTIMFFITEEVKETILDSSQATVI